MKLSNLVSKYHFKQTFLLLSIRFFQKGYFQSETEKSEHDHWIIESQFRNSVTRIIQREKIGAPFGYLGRLLHL